MALPVPRASEHDEQMAEECVFRPVLGPEGRVVVEQLPLTLDVLLDPREGDQVTQSNPHARILHPLFDALRRYLERQPHLAVFTDLLIRWGVAGLRHVSPDVSVVEGLSDREAVDGSLDLGDEPQARVRLVVEVVSTGSQPQRDKDEKHNPEVFQKAGVDDYLLVYPPKPGESERPRLNLLTLDRSGRYQEAKPDRRGRLHLRSVKVRVGVDDEGQLVLEDVVTGDPLLTSDQEEAARHRAEIRAVSEAAARREAQERADAEAEARREAEERAERAEAELARLREEIARLKG